MIFSDPKERTRFVKFAVVGGIGFFVDFFMYNLMRSVGNVSPELSSVISFSTAVISNFTFNRFWTYADSRSKPIIGQLFQFFIINIVGLIIRTSIFSSIYKGLEALVLRMNLFLFFPSDILGENLALAIVVIIVMFWNFYANRYWTYNDVK